MLINKMFSSFCTVLMALGLSVGNAEAAGIGGSKSIAMQRHSAAPRPATPGRQAAPTPPAGAANWMGAIAGIPALLSLP
jgi:hypothetical protein